MDIAKIRKKIKEGKPDKEQKPVETAADESQAEVQPQVISEKADENKQAAELKPRPQEPVQAVQEPEVVKEDTESVSEPVKPESPPATPKAVKSEEIISDIVELLTFQLASEEFAFRISDVEEILTPQQITMVPKAPEYVLGITSVRGKIMPVLDLRKRLSIKDNGISGEARKKILTMKGPKGRIGAMIGKINGVIRIDESDIDEPPSHLTEADLMFIEGVVLYNNRFISVIRLSEAANINLK